MTLADTQTVKPSAVVRWFQSPWAVVAVLGLGFALRALCLDRWSLWEDEEGSIYFSQNIDRQFPQFFPTFFVALRSLLALTGVSVGAARLLSCAIGVATVAAMIVTFRSSLPRTVRVIAALFLAVNLGHIFFSQSIRYYTLVLLFQLLSMHWFLEGFEQDRRRSLVLANVAFFLAMLTHFSAVLLAPVFVAYLAWVLWRRESAPGYRLSNLLLFGLPFAAILLAFANKLVQLRQVFAGSGSGLDSQRDPLRLLVTVAAYFGLALLGLALLGAVRWRSRSVAPRAHCFFILLAFLPILELATIAKLNLINTTWYYGFCALVGLSVLGGVALTDLALAGRTRLAGGLIAAAVLYYGAFLGLYYTTMHGDRPRWEEAVTFVKDRAGVRPGATDNPRVYGYDSLVGLVAFYLGEEPAKTWHSGLVTRLPAAPPPSLPEEEQWFVLEAKTIPEPYGQWLSKHASLEARYEAKTGPIDRSVLVYHYPGGGTH
jgi:hypothetical protein